VRCKTDLKAIWDKGFNPLQCILIILYWVRVISWSWLLWWKQTKRHVGNFL